MFIDTTILLQKIKHKSEFNYHNTEQKKLIKSQTGRLLTCHPDSTAVYCEWSLNIPRRHTIRADPQLIITVICTVSNNLEASVWVDY
jgi:hypothetical protein